MADVVISLDTTGSMSACLNQARRQISSMAKTLFKEIPNLRMGVVFHGDYEDAPPPHGRGPYVIRMLDLTDNVSELVRFVQDTPSTGGSWADECYELVLHEVRRFSWRAGVPKVLGLIGDQNPHPPNYHLNEKRIDWRNELDLLTEANIKVYGIQALGRREATKFYSEIAARTGGYHLYLDQFTDVEQVIMAVCYKQQGDERLKEFVDHVQKQGRISRATAQMYRTLGAAPVMQFKDVDLEAVPPGRFQMLYVPDDTAIKDFVLANGAVFKKGRGFYQFTKRELVQEKKEVVLVDKKTGDMFSGAKARMMIGLPPGVRGEVRPGEGKLADYEVFIQSTSVNRRLVKGTKFLYEVDDV